MNWNNFNNWVKAALVRAIKTFAQAFLAAIPTGAVAFGDVPWALAASIGGVAAILSLVTSVAGLPGVKDDVIIEDLTKQDGE